MFDPAGRGTEARVNYFDTIAAVIRAERQEVNIVSRVTGEPFSQFIHCRSDTGSEQVEPAQLVF